MEDCKRKNDNWFYLSQGKIKKYRDNMQGDKDLEIFNIVTGKLIYNDNFITDDFLYDHNIECDDYLIKNRNKFKLV